MTIRKIIVGLIFLIYFLSYSSNALVSTKVAGVKLRTGPGPSHTQIVDFPKYYPLKVIAKSGKWYKVVDWMNTRGWVYAPLLSNKRTAVVRGWRVNLRSGPGNRYRRITRLYQGYILRVLKSHGNWYKVIVVDPPHWRKGWIYRRLVWG